MDVIGKVQASIAAASQETTLALANANFDMSLIRIEAPAEYKPLGSALVRSKRSVAEDGPAHVTARRLGSLFQSILPQTPNLIRAYGTRASEIAQSPVVNPKGTDADGPFKDYVGIDGTSIWAAATSGSAAIDEATAIWLELVAERKRRIHVKAATAEYFDFTDTLATKLELERAQLANWDASARSWLRAANDSPAVSTKQKTIRSILDRVNVTVRGQHDLFTSVTEAWKLSLETMEKVITGSSYSIEDGSVVIALLAWHIYPDLIVLGSRTEDIPQNDELVEPGGCITVGLKPHSLKHNDVLGVHWSLSLAHLRYYGTPKPTSRSLANTPSGNSRFSREEFTLILIGVIIARWRDEMDVSIEEAMSFMKLVFSKIVELYQTEYPGQIGSWAKAFKTAFDECDAVDNRVRSLARKFVNLGLRNQTLFKPEQNRHPSWHIHFAFLGLNGLEFARALENQEDQHRFFEAAMRRLTRPSSRRERQDCKLLLLLERRAGQEPRKLYIFTRYELNNLRKFRSSQSPICERSRGNYYIANMQDHALKNEGENVFVWADPPRPIHQYMTRHCHEKSWSTHNPLAQPHLHFRAHVFTPHFALLEADDEYETRLASFTSTRTRQEIEDYLLHSKLSKYGFLDLAANQSFFSVLRFMSRMWDFYEHLPGCRISPNILRCNLSEMAARLDSPLRRTHSPFNNPIFKSAASLLNLRSLSHKSGRDCAFKLLVLFEAGVDIETQASSVLAIRWNELVAVSTDDSLYINPVCLGHLDSNPDGSLEIRRVRGNVGRPGLSLIGWFSTRPDPEWREPSVDMWHVVNHNPFQGRVEDLFGSTSLHLKVTGWNRDIDFGGNKCVPDGSYLEAIVSAYDTGNWLGDLTYPHMGEPSLHVITQQEDCRGATPVIGTLPPEDLVLVENWEELLSPHPTQPAVVMCHGNWQARATAISLSLHKGYRTVIFNGHGCWQCAFGLLEKLKREEAAEVLGVSKESPSIADSDEMFSDDGSTSSEPNDDAEEDTDPNVSTSILKADVSDSPTGEAPLAENSNYKDQEGGDDTTLVDQGEASSSLAEVQVLGKVDTFVPKLDIFMPAEDSDSETYDSGSSTASEDIERLEEKLEEVLGTLPYKPTVFIL
ncbi:hypothetical protein PG985_010501 [Apiospora marii]|uniref:Rhodanese domain-containing protein n=1 Tax=Apiospora marii TaxID=335849 RepID=A0ABR1RZM1_9PEZI